MIRFSELMNIVFLTGIAVILLELIFRNNNVILWFDVRLLLGCMLAMMLRLFILADSPVANNVPIVSIYPEICWFLRETLFYWKGISVSLMMFLQIIWLAGAIVLAIYLIKGYHLTQKTIRNHRRLKNPEVYKLVERINQEYGKKAKFHLVTSKSIDTPCIFGVINPYIVIPEMEFDPNEMYLALKHEMIHYYRGDMAVKILCEALKVVYWWNPFVYLLAKLVASMQEINVDFKVVKGMPEMAQLNYVELLVRVARHREMRKKKIQWEFNFRKESPSEVHKRVSLMLKNQKISGKKTTAGFLLAGGILGLIVICPNILTFEPYAIHEEDAVGNVGGREGAIYYLDNQDGTYDIYVNDQYYETVIEIFDEKIPIYDNIEEIVGNN